LNILKNKAIAEVAKKISFEEIYKLMAKYKLDRDIVNKKISILVQERNQLDSAINHENQIALTKRKQLINPK